MSSITLNSITLPPDLYWQDEFGWTPVASSLEYSLAGSGLIQLGKKLTGRAVTLLGEDDCCWTTRETVLALKELADQPGLQMEFNYHGRALTVMFAPGEPPFDAEALWQEWPSENTDTWVITAIRLIEIGES